MNVSLTPELEQLVSNKVKSGMYHSASEVVREGLRLLKVQDDVREYQINQLRKEIDIGADQIERGQYTEYDVDNIQSLVQEIQTEGRKRLASRVEPIKR